MIKFYLGFLLQTSLNLRENLENQEMLNDQMTSEQEKAREQISIMQQEWKREQVLVQELEKEKEEHRQDLEDLMENNR